MPPVLSVIRSIEPSFAARQLGLVAAGLARGGAAPHVVALGAPSPWADALRSSGVAVEALGRRRPFDLRPFLTLRSLARGAAPAVVHAWDGAALRALVLSGSRAPGRLVVSGALPPKGALGRLDAWLLRRAGRVLAFGASEAARYRRLGVADGRLEVVAPGVDLGPAPAGPPSAPGLPAGARVILGVGPLEPHKGFRDAVWAFDMLCYLYDDLHLVLVGAGPDAPRLAAFARALRAAARVHFVGPVADVRPWLARAEVVWVPSLGEGGRGAALEAMAAGRPVVANALPGLAELVADGHTGALVAPGDKPQLARATRLLLDDPARARALGEAGRRRAEEQFGVARLVEGVRRVYATVPS